MSDQQEFWFVARTRRDQELSIRNSLEKLRIVYFLPTQHIVRQLKYQRVKIEIPVTRNLVFIRATKERASALPNDYGIQLFYIHDHITQSMLTIPDKQMEDFISVMTLVPDKVSFISEVPHISSRVRVIEGKLAGIEGELASFSNHSYMIIRVPQILSAQVSIPENYMEIIDPL